MKVSVLDRILLSITSLLAAYQVAVGIEGFTTFSVIAYTIAFGTLLIAGLLILILGFDVLDAPIVVIVSTIIPLSLSLGLVWEHLLSLRDLYLAFVLVGFLAVVGTRIIRFENKLPAIVLILVHGISGMTIFLLPIACSLQGIVGAAFSLVGVGGALIGIGGLLLAFLKTGKPIIKRDKILKVLPALMLLMTICFVVGFRFGSQN